MLRPQAAALLIRDHRILLCLRSATRAYYPGVWDLPGGHVEPGETAAAALRRELAEELGIAAAAPTEPPFAHIVDPIRGFDLKLWRLREWQGEPENRCPEEHETLAWLTPEQADRLPLALPEYRDLIRRALT